MRIGVNPEKKKLNKLHYKKHRVIIPVYISEVGEIYFSNLFKVFKASINSLLQTISEDYTAITIINNACKSEVTDYLDNLLAEKKIDKHVKLVSNYGKVYTVISEARASYEDFITIADADVFYFNNWEKEVFKIFSAFDKVGVVSPVPGPHGALYNNVSLFGSLFCKPKKGNVVDPKSFTLFEKGTNNPKIFQGRKHKWKEKQYYIDNNKVKACVGCGHFVATYKNVFNKIPLLKPEFVFKSGDEDEFLDMQFDKLGYFRVSTIIAYGYHLGTTVPSWVTEYEFNLNNQAYINQIELKKIKKSKVNYIIKRLIFKILKKYKLI